VSSRCEEGVYSMSVVCVSPQAPLEGVYANAAMTHALTTLLVCWLHEESVAK